MTIVGQYGGSSSRTRMHAISSVMLLETRFVPYIAGSGCTRARRGVIGLCSHMSFFVVVFINKTTTLAADRPLVAICDCGG